MNEAIVINGTNLAESLKITLTKKIQNLKEKYHITPGLAIIQIGENLASSLYISKKVALGKSLGINVFEYNIPETTSEHTILNKISSLNHDPKIHGIIIQLPIGGNFENHKIIFAVDPKKDVDGFHPDNLGRLMSDHPRLIPCTPLGCISLIKTVCKDLTGKKALVIGRSIIVGKPISYLLLKENCTVTNAHSKTINLEQECAQADIVVAAIGKEKFIKKEWLKPGAIVIDVGINHFYEGESNKTRIVGDVDFEEAKKVCGAITPVPGGVGPMTVYFLMRNCVIAACQQKNISFNELGEESH